VAAAYLIIADTVVHCCGRRDHPIGDGRSDGHSEAQRHSEAHSSEPVLTLSPVWEKQVFWETIFPGSGKRGKKRVKSRFVHTVHTVRTGNPQLEYVHHGHCPRPLRCVFSAKELEFGNLCCVPQLTAQKLDVSMCRAYESRTIQINNFRCFLSYATVISP
jgi:hypothetical protein